MKHFCLLFILFSSSLICFSQPTKEDSSKELNDLRKLRSQLVEQSAKLEATVNDLQIWLDSCLKKLDVVKADTDNLKLNASKKDKKTIEKNEKRIEQLNTNIKDILKQQSGNKDLLDEANQLIKELDLKINDLSKASG